LVSEEAITTQHSRQSGTGKTGTGLPEKLAAGSLTKVPDSHRRLSFQIIGVETEVDFSDA
jgi:hypothetical protein